MPSKWRRWHFLFSRFSQFSFIHNSIKYWHEKPSCVITVIKMMQHNMLISLQDKLCKLCTSALNWTLPLCVWCVIQYMHDFKNNSGGDNTKHVVFQLLRFSMGVRQTTKLSMWGSATSDRFKISQGRRQIEELALDLMSWCAIHFQNRPSFCESCCWTYLSHP